MKKKTKTSTTPLETPATPTTRARAPRRPRSKPTKTKLMKAIRHSRGIVAEVARKAGCDRSTVNAWLRNHPDLRAALDEEREALLDLAEGKLYQMAIVDGDIRALIFLLENIGRGRGYNRRPELNAATGPIMPIVIDLVDVTPDKGDE